MEEEEEMFELTASTASVDLAAVAAANSIHAENGTKKRSMKRKGSKTALNARSNDENLLKPTPTKDHGKGSSDGLQGTDTTSSESSIQSDSSNRSDGKLGSGGTKEKKKLSPSIARKTKLGGKKEGKKPSKG